MINENYGNHEILGASLSEADHIKKQATSGAVWVSLVSAAAMLGRRKLLLRIPRIALSPAKKVFSSQTVYESLLACMALYELTGGEFWLENCKHLCKLLIGIQQPDGGFDIGYNFRFGENLAKKRQLESTTPEVVGLYALCKYHDMFDTPFFYPILSEDGRVIDRNFYPRSDAWVVHSIAHFMKLAGIDDSLLRICKQSLSNLRKTNFTGKENHAYTMRNAFSMKLIGSFRSFLTGLFSIN